MTSRQPSNCLKTYLSSLRIENSKTISDRGTNKAALKILFKQTASVCNLARTRANELLLKNNFTKSLLFE